MGVVWNEYQKEKKNYPGLKLVVRKRLRRDNVECHGLANLNTKTIYLAASLSNVPDNFKLVVFYHELFHIKMAGKWIPFEELFADLYAYYRVWRWNKCGGNAVDMKS